MRLKILGSLALAAALTLGLASPAAAKTVTFFDETNDATVSPSAPIAPLDLYYVDVKHTKKKLIITATFFNTPLGVKFGDRWTTARLRLETTGDKKSDYTLQATHLNNSDFTAPPREPIATYFYGPKDKLIAQSADARKKNAGKFVFGIEKAGPATLTFSVPLKKIGNPAKIKFALWIDLLADNFSTTYGLETYPNIKPNGSFGWSKAIKLKK